MSGQEIIQVDAFTSERFAGNQAAICVMEQEADADWMQTVAKEMNLSETAYVVPREDGFGLRWFTPGTEVKLCGHATLAAAHVLYTEGHVARDTACRFHTLSGELIVTSDGDRLSMDFPAEPSEAIEEPEGLAEALGASPTATHLSPLEYCLAEVASEEELRALSPDFNALNELPFHGFVVTAKASMEGKDVVSRFFAPAFGINEDPVTGSAHCLLATYWAAKLGRNELEAYQASERGGHVSITLRGDRVTLAGQAVTTMRGVLV